jgi:hypothetical protein
MPSIQVYTIFTLFKFLYISLQTVAATSLIRSEGASLICNPRCPALT